MRRQGIFPDFRAPNIIRLAPAPLYTTYHELWQTVQALREIVDTGEHLHLAEGRDLVA
jgi:kynureninase